MCALWLQFTQIPNEPPLKHSTKLRNKNKNLADKLYQAEIKKTPIPPISTNFFDEKDLDQNHLDLGIVKNIIDCTLVHIEKRKVLRM